jgi:hypothetical protein
VQSAPERRIFFLYANYAYEKSAKAIAKQLRIYFDSDRSFLFKKITTQEEFKKITIMNSLENQVIFFCCGGMLLNSCLDVLSFNNIKCLKLSIFPGIAIRSQIEAFLTRIRTDYVLINSKNDLLYHKLICKLIGIKFNGFLYGPTWVDTEVHHGTDKKSHTAIFFEQFKTPHSEEEKKYLLKCLTRIAQNNPNHVIYIKSRPLENHKGKTLEDFCKTQNHTPINLKILHESENHILNSSNTYITISSSAAFDAIAQGKKIFLLKEFKKHKYQSNFFERSGLYRYANDIFLNKPNAIDEQWLKANYTNPSEYADRLHNLIKYSMTTIQREKISRTSLIMRSILLLPFSCFYAQEDVIASYRRILKSIDILTKSKVE